MATKQNPFPAGTDNREKVYGDTTLSVRGRAGEVVFQNTGKQFVNDATGGQPRRQRRRYVKTPQNVTLPLRRNRAIFALFVNIWQQIPQETRDIWNVAARTAITHQRYHGPQRCWSGFQWFLSVNLKPAMTRAASGATGEAEIKPILTPP